MNKYLERKKWKPYLVGIIFCLFTGSLVACGQGYKQGKQSTQEELYSQTPIESSEDKEQKETLIVESESAGPQITEVDWSSYFPQLNGSAVFFHPTKNEYIIYNEELANIQRSPCSTFKIISSLIALEEGVINQEDSVRKWNGETFWKAEWNQDISFEDAFVESCVWYFREVMNDLGEETIQNELNRLSYGNCDISDWQGELNNNNSNPLLTGFWIESSLLISPKEQTEVLSRIFEEESDYSKDVLDALKEVMYFETSLEENGISMYGKTGMGKSNGVTVDAWYTGFLEKESEKVYFCIYLGESSGEVSSPKAREIAISLALEEDIINWIQ